MIRDERGLWNGSRSHRRSACCGFFREQWILSKRLLLLFLLLSIEFVNAGTVLDEVMMRTILVAAVYLYEWIRHVSTNAERTKKGSSRAMTGRPLYVAFALPPVL
jgi:hypothetical protein